MTLTEKYEAVIGLEIHAQLLTKTKAYSQMKTFMENLLTPKHQ